MTMEQTVKQDEQFKEAAELEKTIRENMSRLGS
jgi:hypothetical protein